MRDFRGDYLAQLNKSSRILWRPEPTAPSSLSVPSDATLEPVLAVVLLAIQGNHLLPCLPQDMRQDCPTLMPLVRHCRFTAIDFESAGASRGRTDTPVQIGLAGWSVEQGHHEPFVSYLHTDAPIQWAARKVHGIGPEHLAGAPRLLTLWPTLKMRLAGAVVVAHGKGTEKRFLRAFPGHGFSPWIDTLLLARATWPELPDHSLGALCEVHGLTPTVRQWVPEKSWHDALFDAVASLVVLAHLLESHNLVDLPVECLIAPDTSHWHQLRRIPVP
jgi:DNA polymerase-3 subunit epsilon